MGSGGSKPGVKGTSGQPSNLEDGTLSRTLGSIPGVVGGWIDDLGRYGDEKKKEVGEWAWREVGVGYQLAAGNVTEIQARVDQLSAKAKVGLKFDETERAFVGDLYEWIATGGRWQWLASSTTEPGKGLWEAGELLDHYLHGGGEELQIDADIYETSVIVRYAMGEIKAAVAHDLRTTGKMRRDGEIWSTHVLKSKSFGDVAAKGQVIDNGVLLAEQGNRRLKYANNRFVLRSKSVAVKAAERFRVETKWSVVDVWDYASFEEQRRKKRHDVTVLPLRGGASLSLPDGLSAYLVDVGLAKPFTFTARWTETWMTEAPPPPAVKTPAGTRAPAKPSGGARPKPK